MWTDSARAKYARPAKRYATDLTDAEFALVAPRLPSRSRLGRPRTTDLRAVLDAIFYLLRTGCQWAMLPKQFPPKSTVFGYFQRWWRDGTVLGLYYGLLVLARQAAGREAQPTAGIVDSQSMKTSESGGPRGYDAGKKINGRKRHVLVDTQGFLLRGIVHPASIQDRDGLAPLLGRIRRRFPFDGACAPSIRDADRIDAAGVDGCATSSPTAAMPAPSCTPRWPHWARGRRRSSSDPMSPRDSS